MTGVQDKEDSRWKRHDAFTDGVTQNTPSTVTQALHPRSVKEKWGTGNHEEEGDPVPTFRGGPFEHEKEPSPVGESIRTRIVHAANTHVGRIQAAPMTLPKTEDTISR